VLGSDGRAVTNEKQWSGTRAGPKLSREGQVAEKFLMIAFLTFLHRSFVHVHVHVRSPVDIVRDYGVVGGGPIASACAGRPSVPIASLARADNGGDGYHSFVDVFATFISRQDSVPP